MTAPGFAEALYCVRRGVPYETAMRMSPARRLAHVVTFGEMEGGTFDWRTKSWERPAG